MLASMNRMPAVTVERTALACASCEVMEVMMNVSSPWPAWSRRLFAIDAKANGGCATTRAAAYESQLSLR